MNIQPVHQAIETKKADASSNLEVNDFVANFLSNSVKEEGVEISPLEIEFLYLFKRVNKPMEEKDIINIIVPNISQHILSELLKRMEKSKFIVKHSPYQLGDEGNRLLKVFTEIKKNAEPIIKNDFYYNRMYQASSTSIKMR
ncbi:MAG: hypothetical protein ABIF85_06110 [Nanoarchaeota archaeon]